MSATFDRTWIWHPAFPEHQLDTAGLLVHFRRQFTVDGEIPACLKIHISADTKYKLYVNHHLVSFGPVKGDQSLWFYDEVDIAPYLQRGSNFVGVHVLRLFCATQFAPSFPRLASGGLYVTVPEDRTYSEHLSSSPLWEAAIDPFVTLRVNEPEDSFLHIYEAHRRQDADCPLDWRPAKILEYKNSTGNAPPWNLSPRLIPPHRVKTTGFAEIHNVQSDLAAEAWRSLLLADRNAEGARPGLRLPPGSRHRFELEIAAHTTAFLGARFLRPRDGGGSSIRLTYAESYEDEPDLYKGERRKAHRRDRTKQLIGPHDFYELQGQTVYPGPQYLEDETRQEAFVPFHYRTFRFIEVEINVGAASELVFQGIDVDAVHYPLDVQATIAAAPATDVVDALWTTSLRTLANCMHDCYEDCPFYEQLQYAMDTRSSALFTYCVAGDDRLARQAIVQLYYSFQPSTGLTASRAPSHRRQVIPHFSLYWICMLGDHWDYFGDARFLAPFAGVIDAILSYFALRVDAELQLVRSDVRRPGIWNYIDWTDAWKPYGSPPVCERTGFSTFTNQMYAHTLNVAARVVGDTLGRHAVASEYRQRAQNITAAVQKHCFDGVFFTDSLASAQADEAPAPPRSQHCQVWAVLSGAVQGRAAQELLRQTMHRTAAGEFVQGSIAMSFYILRALSMAGGSVYDDHFHTIWKAPWLAQLAMGVTTWVEDDIAQRSDCHAWGSVPLYEFVAEVAGVQPAAPGWATIQVRPRLQLYAEFNARVPMRMVDGKTVGLVHVSWKRETRGTGVGSDVRVRIKVEMQDDAARSSVPLYIYLPGQEMITVEGNGRETCFSTSV
ncbi:hypothetical protein SBRCBS47491_003498 [Sporothrix bragantina]|uniref:Alpha-L-rhamnosidase six-hairpin glycosidase domain-containing protein n=1 Tax=Sporothrix bragantina TaxID=671064 RepID=A0ABP0BH00_9PEZI